ncbi:MAG: hypothetical protein KDA75_10335, partial [Planctomycetaceae bacterium]|nr:hypothetical protein [Planctomycetaceae bacterium]
HLQRYVDGGSDRHLDVSRSPASNLSEEDALYLLDHFFMANAETMIRPWRRYRDLAHRRGNVRTEPARAALSRFSTSDLRDLQVWNNLTWIHELVFERDQELRQFRMKGEGWTESEKEWLLQRQREILAEVIPLHRRLSDGGQVELTTTPFYHPILPLLWDKQSARQAMPGCELPRHLERYPEDVQRHLERAIEYHAELFGRPPHGMWPSEGSVSQDVVAAIADAGIHWIATDEEILTRSLDGQVSRDPQGCVNRPDRLYQPWQVEQAGKSLEIVFRDHALSDLIGFHYQRSDPEWAADDLLNRTASIGRSVSEYQPGRPALVPVILDGENCWEHYPDGGVRFLRKLYRDAAGRADISADRISDYLDAHPATERIPKLFAGSWIFHNFAIWIGHHEDRTAWDALHETRRFLKHADDSGKYADEVLRRAWNELDIAEGSDWFWWYGDDHNSELDAVFDQLFRRHLENVYRVLGEAPPTSLSRAIGGHSPRVLHTAPSSFLDVRVDGQQTSYFEWAGAGRFRAGSERGSMTLVSKGMVRELQFGFDAATLFVRIDLAEAAGDLLQPDHSVRLRFVEPQETEVVLRGWDQDTLRCALEHNAGAVEHPGLLAGAERIIEIAIPFKALGLKTGDPLSFFVELFLNGQSIDRAPNEGMIDLRVPGAAFEARNWMA